MNTPNDKFLAFLSHASYDAEFARFLADSIEDAFKGKLEIFVTSRPDAIESAESWRNKIFDKLDKAQVLIVLLTSSSVSSAWVHFETGYFWHKHKGENIHVLRHHDAIVPGTLAEKQGKLVTRGDELASFFASLSKALECEVQPNISAILEAARNIKRPVPERSLQYFESMLDVATWERSTIARVATIGEVADLLSNSNGVVATHNEVWVCAEDANLQLVIDEGSKEPFSEAWIKRIAIYGYANMDKSEFAYKYSVYLSLAGIPIYQLIFVSLDGGRYFVPLPQIRQSEKALVSQEADPEFFWQRGTLAYKVAQIIGKYYRFESLEEFAYSLGIPVE